MPRAASALATPSNPCLRTPQLYPRLFRFRSSCRSRTKRKIFRAVSPQSAWADEIFVVDSQSTDGSPRIAEELGARVVQFEFNGTWPKKKNWALENLPVPQRVGLHPRRRRSPAGGSGSGVSRCDRGRRGDGGILDQPAFHVHGPLAPARLLSELESAPLSALVRPLREADRRRDRERRQRSARARRGAGADRPAALRDRSLRLSLRRSVSSKNTIAIPTGKRGSPSPSRVREVPANCKARPSRSGAG